MKQQKLFGLFIPIYLETLLFMLAGMVDTLMLSSEGDKAVGAVGTANTYIGIFIIMFSIISMGMIAVMTQNIGAGKSGIAYQARRIGLIFNLTVGIMMSIFLYFFSEKVLITVGIADALLIPSNIYLKIVGGGCVLMALIPVLSGYLRAFGHTKEALYATTIANVINIILNAIFLYVLKWGVAGVALATVISRAFNVIALIILQKKINIDIDDSRTSTKELLKSILLVGVPSALENIIYNIAITIAVSFFNEMDPDGFNIAARAYTIQITNFSFAAGSALAQANAIMTGWRIGAKDYDACEKETKKAAIIGIIIAVSLDIIFIIASPVLVGIFTKDENMINLVTKLIAIDVFLEIGRVTNLVYGQALKTSGDAIFPVILATIFMFVCSAGGTYIFGLKLELLAIGGYIGFASDEIVRAIGMVLRWRSGKWKTKKLIHD